MIRRVCLTLAVGLIVCGATDVRSNPGQRVVEAPRCIQRTRLASPIALPSGEVFFRGQPNPQNSYFARFKGKPCAGLDRFSILSIDTTATGYCAGDKIRAYRDVTRIDGPVCVIDHFEPVDGRGR